MTKNTSRMSGFIIRVIICLSISSLCISQAFAIPKNRENILLNEEKAIQLSKFWNIDSINQAIHLFEETSIDWENINEPQKAAFCLNERAKLAQIISDYEAAFQSLHKALIIEKNSNLIEEKVITLSLLSLIFRQKGDKRHSQKYYQESIKLSKKVDSAIAKAYALYSAGLYNFYNGNIKETISLFEQANVFAQQTQDIQLISQILFYIGFSYGREENPYYGLEKMNLALRKCEYFGYVRGKALSFFGIGFLHMIVNEKQKALDFYKKAEELFPTDFEWIEKAKLYNNIGVIYEEYGDLDLSEIYRQKAFEYYQKGNYPFGQLATMPSLARIKLLKGDSIEAKQLYNKALIFAKELDDQFHIAIINEGLGNLDFINSNYDSAISNYLKVLQFYNDIKIKLPRLENNLGKSFMKKGNLIVAKNYFQIAYKNNEKIKDLLPLTENLFNLAKIHFLEGDTQNAIENISKSLYITEKLYSDVTNANLKRTYFSNIYERYEFYINLLIQKHKQSLERRFIIQALQASEKSRSRSILEKLILSEANFTKDAHPNILNKEKEIRNLLNTNSDKLTELLSQNTNKSEIEKISSELNKLEYELEEIKAELKQKSPIYSAIKNPEPFDLNDFQQNILDDNSILLEFSLGEKESYLWIVSKDDFSYIILPDQKVIEESIEKIHKTFDARQPLPNEDIESYQKRKFESEAIYNQEILLLSKEILEQITEKIANKRLIIIPDGKLALLPFATLIHPLTNKPLIQHNEIVYQPSASFLSFLTKLGSRNSHPQKDLLVFADPVFSDDDIRLTTKPKNEISLPSVLSLNLRDFRLMDNGKIPRLLASQNEAESIAKIVGTSQTSVISGFEANRERVLNSDLSNYKILHFATHGLVDVKRPEVSSIVLSQYDIDGNKNEGFLRLQDIYALNLNTDLVVLSSCESGVGKEIKGEGLMSINNAFLQAGAKSVLSSAWKVDDYATAELMKLFYQELIDKKLPPSEALRQAQIRMSENPQFSSSFYWAAFTVQGEFRHAVSIEKSYQSYYFILGIGGILLLVFIAFFIKRKLHFHRN